MITSRGAEWTFLADGDTGAAGGAILATVFIVVVLALFALFVVTLVSILRSDRYTGAGKALWALAVLAFPVLGVILWFAVGRHSSLGTTSPPQQRPQ